MTFDDSTIAQVEDAFNAAEESTAVRNVLALIDESSVLHIASMSRSYQLNGALRSWGASPTGFAEELVRAISGDSVRRVKLTVIAENLKRVTQLRFGPLITIGYALLIATVATSASGVTPFSFILLAALVLVVAVFLVTSWTSQLLILVEALISSSSMVTSTS